MESSRYQPIPAARARRSRDKKREARDAGSPPTMATTRKLFILGSAVAAAVAALFSLVALGTEQWVTASLLDQDPASSAQAQNSYVRYGLFKGFMRVETGLPGSYELDMTCSFSKNICAQLCEDTDERVEWLENSYDNGGQNVSATCFQISRNVYNYFRGTRALPRAAVPKERRYINAGVWLCTVMFLALSATAGVLAVVLALWNFFFNPIEVYLSTPGLYALNAAAWAFCILYVCLWGAHFAVTLFYDVAIDYTIAGYFESEKKASLGYSYWINFVPLVLYPVAVVSLYLRDYLNARDPGQKNIHLEETADPGIYLY